MDEISLLRRLRTDIAERSPEQVARGRAALFAQIESEAPVTLFAQLGDDTAFAPMPARRRRRRRIAWAGFSVVGAAGVAVALVATNLLGFAGWHGGADPAAASALGAAAVATLEVSDPVVGPGQYMLVRTDSVGVSQIVLKTDAPPSWASLQHRNELYVPADRGDAWVWVRCGEELLDAFGADAASVAAFVAGEPIADSINYLPAGRTAAGDTFTGYQHGTEGSDDYAALPQDPKQLLDWIYAEIGMAGPSRDGEALVWIADTLRSGTVPAETRALLYRTAAEIPDVTITDEQATLNGVTGIAIGRVETNGGFRQDLIIDPATGLFIGERRVTVRPGTELAVGTVQSSSAVATAIVDAAPANPSASCGPP